MAEKNWLDYLHEATQEELKEEQRRRRASALINCSDKEIEEELKKRSSGTPDKPPRLVEK